MFRLEFKTDNAAFAESLPDEVARILCHVAARIVAGEYNGRVRDVNGNCVGSYSTSLTE